MFYVKLYVHSLIDKLKWFYENARCYNKISTLHCLSRQFCSKCAGYYIPYCFTARRCFVVFVVTLSGTGLIQVVPSLTCAFNFSFSLAYISLAAFWTKSCVHFSFLPCCLSFPFQDLRKYFHWYFINVLRMTGFAFVAFISSKVRHARATFLLSVWQLMCNAAVSGTMQPGL